MSALSTLSAAFLNKHRRVLIETRGVRFHRTGPHVWCFCFTQCETAPMTLKCVQRKSLHRTTQHIQRTQQIIMCSCCARSRETYTNTFLCAYTHANTCVDIWKLARSAFHRWHVMWTRIYPSMHLIGSNPKAPIQRLRSKGSDPKAPIQRRRLLIVL